MLRQMQNTAEKLERAGIKPADRIAILSENTAECVSLILSLWKIGAVAVPLSTRYPLEKLNTALKDSSSSRIFVSKTYRSLDIEIQKLNIEDFVDLTQSPITDLKFEDLSLDLNAQASIIFTSASTGTPKGVMHTISDHYYSALGSNKNIPLASGDAWLMSLPIYHISGFSLIMRSLIAGVSVIFPKPAEPLQDTIKNPSITHISAVPAQLSKLLENPRSIERLKNFKAILIGGSAVPINLIKESLSNDLSIFTTYGSTEMASQITTTKPGGLQTSSETSGRLLDYRQLKIADDGEILVKGKTLFKGYVKKDSLELPIDEDGFFRTGDIGEVKDGNLFVTARKDLMFISGGENIHPQEIERAIEQIENVAQAIVVPIDDPNFGQIPAAIIKMKDTYTLEPQKIKHALSKKIENFKIPKTLLPWPAKETPSIKPGRKAFQAYAAANETPKN